MESGSIKYYWWLQARMKRVSFEKSPISYLSIQDHDPVEKQTNEEKVRRSVWNLESDSQGQKNSHRLDYATEVTKDLEKGKGIVFWAHMWAAFRCSYPIGSIKLRLSSGLVINAGDSSSQNTSHTFVSTVSRASAFASSSRNKGNNV